jgi:hypothetical protein
MKYKNMNTIPIGAIMRVKKTNLLVKLVEILHFPTRFKCNDSNIYATHEVIIKWSNY